MDLARMRLEYETEGIDRADFADEPITQFERWLQVAVDAGLDEPNAMVVATVDAEGQPWSRYVLLKAVSEAGFEFYTNYESHKSNQMGDAPRASITFGWPGLRRQINIAGSVRRVSPEVSDAYWAVRPRGSQLGGWASNQSRPLESREELLERYRSMEQRFPEEVPRPEHWGGWVVQPHVVEFWQGRTNRLHDRLRYVADTAAISGGTAPVAVGSDMTAPASWSLVRLAP